MLNQRLVTIPRPSPNMASQSTTLVEKKKESLVYALADGRDVSFELYNVPKDDDLEGMFQLASHIMLNKKWNAEKIKIDIPPGSSPEQAQLLRFELAAKMFLDLAVVGHPEAKLAAELAQKDIENQRICLRHIEARGVASEMHFRASQEVADARVSLEQSARANSMFSEEHKTLNETQNAICQEIYQSYKFIGEKYFSDYMHLEGKGIPFPSVPPSDSEELIIQLRQQLRAVLAAIKNIGTPPVQNGFAKTIAPYMTDEDAASLEFRKNHPILLAEYLMWQKEAKPFDIKSSNLFALAKRIEYAEGLILKNLGIQNALGMVAAKLAASELRLEKAMTELRNIQRWEADSSRAHAHAEKQMQPMHKAKRITTHASAENDMQEAVEKKAVHAEAARPGSGRGAGVSASGLFSALRISTSSDITPTPPNSPQSPGSPPVDFDLGEFEGQSGEWLPGRPGIRTAV